MEQMDNIIGINPACLALLNGAEVLARFARSKTSIYIQIDLPPPVDSSVEHLRREFAKIESYFSGKPLEIMQCLLATQEGKMHREELKAEVWQKCPQNPCFRRAIHRLNAGLAKQNFGYIVRGNLKGSKSVYRLVPMEE